MVSYVVLVLACIVVGAMSSIVTIVIGRRDIDGVLRVITSDFDEGTYMTLESYREVATILKKKQVRFAVRPEHYKSQE